LRVLEKSVTPLNNPLDTNLFTKQRKKNPHSQTREEHIKSFMQNKEHTMIKIENMHARVSMFCSISFTSVLDAFKVRTSIQQRRVKSSSKDYCKPLAEKIPPTTATFEHPITNKN